jgi:hypothetical protein
LQYNKQLILGQTAVLGRQTAVFIQTNGSYLIRPATSIPDRDSNTAISALAACLTSPIKNHQKPSTQ